MKHTISLDLEELNSSFIDKLKVLFANSNARLTIVVEDEEEETDYLLRSDSNKEILLKSLDNARKGNIIMPNLEEFRNLANA